MSPVKPLQIQYISFNLSKKFNTDMRNSLNELWFCGVGIDRFGGLTG